VPSFSFSICFSFLAASGLQIGIRDLAGHGLPEREFPTYYATKFDTVKMDSAICCTSSKARFD